MTRASVVLIFQRLKVPRHEVYFSDIGANIGVFTLTVAAQGFSVIAVEAMTSNANAIRHSLCANPSFLDRVYLIQKVEI